jgi:small subunit ribosomal protein S18
MNTEKQYKKISVRDKSFNYIDLDMLTQYITEQGKILPKRLTGLTTKKQREITKQIKRARVLSLMPFVNK